MMSVEYAMEAISHAGTVLAVASKDGIALAAEKVCRKELNIGRSLTSLHDRKLI